MKKILKNNKIEILFNSEILEICGNDKPKSVEFLKIVNNLSKEITEINVNAVFMAIGRKPESDVFLNSDLNINEDGYIITEKDSARTNIKHVYAVGDITNKKYKQAIVAAGYGCIAGLEIEEDKEVL